LRNKEITPKLRNKEITPKLRNKEITPKSQKIKKLHQSCETNKLHQSCEKLRNYTKVARQRNYTKVAKQINYTKVAKQRNYPKAVSLQGVLLIWIRIRKHNEVEKFYIFLLAFMKDFLAPVIRNEHRILQKCRILIFCFLFFSRELPEIRIYPLAV
jgi:hypothetical protein